MRQTSQSGVVPLIKFVDMFSGIGGFREGLTRAGGFECVGHCEIDKYANRSYNALFDTKGEWFIEDARKADPSTMPDFQLLCGGFPCQSFSVAGARRGFSDPRGTLFFEIARLVEARHPAYLILENVPGLLNHSRGETYATILNTLDRLGYGVEWQCLNSKDFGVPQSRNRVYIVGYLDERCRGKVFPFTETTGGSLIQTHGGHQGERVYSPEGLSCTLAANPGGFGGKTGLYEVGVPIKCATKTGYQMAQVGDSIDLSYATVNSRRGRVGKEIAHTLTTGCQQGTVEVRPVKNPIKSDLARNTERTGKPGAPMHAAGPTPPYTTGKITSIAKEGGTWLIWFNGQEAYCCSHGLNGQPKGCPTYSFSHVSRLEPGQYTPGNHYANQVNIWGGLGQLSLDMLDDRPVVASLEGDPEGGEEQPDILGSLYDETQQWIMENYPDSYAAQTYIAAAEEQVNGTDAQSGENGYYTYIYNPPAGYA